MKRTLTAIVLALLGGCASTPVPAEKMASSQAAIRASEEAGAKQVPSAALHMQLAREQMEQAKQLIGKGKNDRAKSFLMRAEADAELALALTREHATQVDAQRALTEVHDLQQKIQN